MPTNSVSISRVLRILRGLLFLMLAAAPHLPAEETSAEEAASAVQDTPPTPEPASSETSTNTPAATAGPLKLDGYTLTGEGSFGYRFVSLGGNQGQYDQLFNLQQGFRLFDFQLNLDSAEIGKGWFDSLAVTAQGSVATLSR